MERYENERLIVTNTAIIINNYKLGDIPDLERPFLVWNPTYHKLEPFLMYYDEEYEQLYLPVGIDLWFVQRKLGVKRFKRVEHHMYKNVGKILMRYPPRDDRQWEALYFLLGVKQYEDNKFHHILSLNLSTGIGKSYLGITTIATRRLRSIIITFSSSLLEQWKGEILKYTNLTEEDVYFIEGSNVISMIMNDRSNKAKKAKVFLCTHRTLKSYGDNYGWDKIYDLFEHLKIGVKIIDEFHYNIENGWKINYYTNVKYTYLITATPGRSPFFENKIYQLSTKNIPSIELFDEDVDPHTNYAAIKYNSKPSPLVISMCKNKYGLDRMKYINWITKNPEFYKMLTILMPEVLNILFSRRKKVLMYIGTNDGILRVYHWMCTNYPILINQIGIFSSLVDKEDKMVEKEKPLLLSTLKSAGLGEHIEGLYLTIVLAEPFKSEIQARQTLGRTRDPDTMYIELVDLGFKEIRKFYNYKIPIFNKYAASTSDTTMSSYEIDKRVQAAEQKKLPLEMAAIEFFDDRFEYPDDIMKEEPQEGPEPAIIFFDPENKKY